MRSTWRAVHRWFIYHLPLLLLLLASSTDYVCLLWLISWAANERSFDCLGLTCIIVEIWELGDPHEYVVAVPSPLLSSLCDLCSHPIQRLG